MRNGVEPGIPEKPLRRFLIDPCQLVIKLHLGRKFLDLVNTLVIRVQPDHLEILIAVFILHLHQLRHLAAARAAPRRPKVQKQDLALAVLELESSAVDILDLGLGQD